MLHTAAEGGTATEGDRGGGGVPGRVTWGLGRGRGGGGGGRRRERRLVPWIPRPKLIPKWDGMHGAPGDAHLHLEVSGKCRGSSCVLEALWRNGRVHIYRDVRAELLQLARVVTCDVAVRGPGARLARAGRLEVPGRGGACSFSRPERGHIPDDVVDDGAALLAERPVPAAGARSRAPGEHPARHTHVGPQLASEVLLVEAPRVSRFPGELGGRPLLGHSLSVPKQEPARLGSQQAAGLPAEILHSQIARPPP